MTTLRQVGDEVQGRRVLCFFRKRAKEQLIHLTEGHRGWRLVIEGLPARAIVEKEYELAMSQNHNE